MNLGAVKLEIHFVFWCEHLNFLTRFRPRGPKRFRNRLPRLLENVDQGSESMRYLHMKSRGSLVSMKPTGYTNN